MIASPTGHESQAVMGCVLWTAATTVEVPVIYIGSFLGDIDESELGRGRVNMESAGLPSFWKGL